MSLLTNIDVGWPHKITLLQKAMVMPLWRTPMKKVMKNWKSWNYMLAISQN